MWALEAPAMTASLEEGTCHARLDPGRPSRVPDVSGRVLIPVDQGRLFADGVKQFERWRSTRAPADLESAIASLAELDAGVPDDPAVRFWAGLLHAMALGDRYELSNSVDDIDGVIERLKRVVACPDPPPPVGDDDMDTYRVALGRALANRIDMYGRPGGPPRPATRNSWRNCKQRSTRSRSPPRPLRSW